MPCSYHFLPPDLAEDQLTVDHPTEEQPAPAVHIEEPQIPASSVPALVATAPISSIPLEPSAPSTV